MRLMEQLKNAARELVTYAALSGRIRPLDKRLQELVDRLQNELSIDAGRFELAEALDAWRSQHA